MFALGIQYLNGWVTAADVADRNRVEWPPHPGRVFMALANAYFTAEKDPAECAALEWLETLGAPAIAAGGCEARSVVPNYVPVNDQAGPAKAILQSAPGLTRTRQPRTFARAWLDHDVVHLVWEETELPAGHRGAFERLVSRVSRIGHSSTFVQMWIETGTEGIRPNHVASDRAASHRFRVPTPGTLQYLEQRFNGDELELFCNLKIAEIEAAFSGDNKAKAIAREQLRERFSNQPPVSLRPELSRWQGYAPMRDDSRDEVFGTVFDSRLLIYKLVRKDSSFRALELATTLRLTSALRGALIKSADGDLPEAIIGHQPNGKPSEKPHMAMLPLAFAGSEHADGKLMGLALALPCDLDPQDRRKLLITLNTATKSLKLGNLGEWMLEAPTEDRPAHNLRAETWSAWPHGTTEWGTVTPIALERHAKSKKPDEYRAEIAENIAESCARVTGGIRPREVVVLQVSPHLGVPHSRAFPRLSRKDNSQLRHTHAIIVFDAPLVGPLAIGAGRYRGYGFCRPLSE
jgi:CRISPR-associated protein Csb2